MNTNEKMSIFNRLDNTAKTFYYYYCKIYRELIKQNWKRTNSLDITYEASFSTISFPYNYDAYLLLQKSFKRIGWNIIMDRFKRDTSTKEINYTFKVTKII